MPKARKQGNQAPPCPRVQLQQICQLDGETRRDGLFSTFLFHVFQLLPCKSQFGKKHDKIMVGPAESAQLCRAMISAVNRVHSQHTKARLHSSASSFIAYISFQKVTKCLSALVFFLFHLCIELSSLCSINTEGINVHGEYDLPASHLKT